METWYCVQYNPQCVDNSKVCSIDAKNAYNHLHRKPWLQNIVFTSRTKAKVLCEKGTFGPARNISASGRDTLGFEMGTLHTLLKSGWPRPRLESLLSARGRYFSPSNLRAWKQHPRIASPYEMAYFSNSARLIDCCAHDTVLARGRSSVRTTDFPVWAMAPLPSVPKFLAYTKMF